MGFKKVIMLSQEETIEERARRELNKQIERIKNRNDELEEIRIKFENGELPFQKEGALN